MRKIIVLAMITMDGVMQAPSGPEDDPLEDFNYGGWTVQYVDDSLINIIREELSMPVDLLLGRKTYEVFAGYWPKHTGVIGGPFNKATKYVVSGKTVDLSWKESVLINGDVVAKIKALKEKGGSELQVHGSRLLIQTLLKNDLVDEVRLRIFPVALGTGKRLFAEGAIPAAFELVESKALPSGVIIANYKRAGKVRTGTLS